MDPPTVPGAQALIYSARPPEIDRFLSTPGLTPEVEAGSIGPHIDFLTMYQQMGWVPAALPA